MQRPCTVLLNPLNAELNHTCHFLALLGAHHILHFSRIRVNVILECLQTIILIRNVILGTQRILTIWGICGTYLKIKQVYYRDVGQ